jgi:hypothetical protein
LKTYQLEIQDLIDLDTNWQTGWWSKGHHEPAAFCEELQRNHGVTINPFRYQHVWRRCVPREHGSELVPAESGAIGAVPVTVVERLTFAELTRNALPTRRFRQFPGDVWDGGAWYLRIRHAAESVEPSLPLNEARAGFEVGEQLYFAINGVYGAIEYDPAGLVPLRDAPCA